MSTSNQCFFWKNTDAARPTPSSFQVWYLKSSVPFGLFASFILVPVNTITGSQTLLLFITTDTITVNPVFLSLALTLPPTLFVEVGARTFSSSIYMRMKVWSAFTMTSQSFNRSRIRADAFSASCLRDNLGYCSCVPRSWFALDIEWGNLPKLASCRELNVFYKILNPERCHRVHEFHRKPPDECKDLHRTIYLWRTVAQQVLRLHSYFLGFCFSDLYVFAH